MTYWVIVRSANEKEIHIAADVRTSKLAFPASNCLIREYADVSEKLFVVHYIDDFNKKISIALCTAGFAHDVSGVTISSLESLKF